MKCCRPAVARTALLVSMLAVAVVVRYRNLPASDFFQDDFVHMYDLANYGVAKLLLSAHGGHAKIISNGTYAVLHAIFGWQPRGWFTTVLVVHVVNTLLLFALVRRYGGSALVALATAALWGLNLLQGPVLGWFVTSGHVLVCTLSLLLFHDMARVTESGARISGARCVAWVALGVAIASCYGMGGGIAGALWLAALVMLPANLPGRRRAVLALSSLLVLVPTMYVAVHVLRRRWYPVPLFYETPVFDLPLAELVHTAGKTILMLAQLVSYGIVALLVGPLNFTPHQTVDIGPVTGLPLGSTIALLGVFVAGTIAVATWALRGSGNSSLRAPALGLAILALATYAFIAWGTVISGRIESTQKIPGLQTVTAAIAAQAATARHHYAATMLLATSLALGGEALRRRSRHWQRGVEIVLAAIIATLAAVVASGSVAETPHPRVVASRQFASIFRRLEHSAESVPPGGTAYVENAGLGLLKGAPFPGWAGLMTIYHPDGMLHGRKIRFVEADPDLLAVLRAQVGTPIASLVVAPQDLPQAAP